MGKKYLIILLTLLLLFIPTIYANNINNSLHLINVFTAGGKNVEQKNLSVGNAIGQVGIGRSREGQLTIHQGIYYILTTGIIPTILWKFVIGVALISSFCLLFFYGRPKYKEKPYIMWLLRFVGLFMIINVFTFFVALEIPESTFLINIQLINIWVVISAIFVFTTFFIIDILTSFGSMNRKKV